MDTVPTPKIDYSAAQSQWALRTRWYRRLSVRVGLEGKLVLAFTFLFSLALLLICWTFVTRSNKAIDELLGEQVKQLATTLALASHHAFSAGNTSELKTTGSSLVKSRNILYIAFLNADFKLISASHRDPDFVWTPIPQDERKIETLCQVRQRVSLVFGDYLEIVAPVISTSNTEALRVQSKLVGYVMVGMSQRQERAQIQRVNTLVIGIGCIVALFSLPLSFMLVRRIFVPIRQLVKATQQIASGRPDTQVAVDRPDVIGELSRSFNEMVNQVKQQQEALASANSDLECKVQQRTAELQSVNRRLRSEISEKEDFLRAVSHDLNAPLRNISGMASMLLLKHRENFDEDIIHRLERIQKNVEVETNLIGELLELSRIKTRRQKLEPVEIDALVREMAGLFEQDLQSRNITLIIDSLLPVLTCEKSRMRQVFQNLIDNAIKYMGEGELKEIHVGCQMTIDHVEFYVRDTGRGIDPEDIDSVFHVFRRGKGAVIQGISGKGVGLASVKSIIEVYEGSIHVESRLNAGSTFRFTIHARFVPALARPGMSATSFAGQEIEQGV